jgi:ppGpp synthetase/RelA/SpoT-type nucleotidyltranferase
MPERTVQDRLREEYFDLLPDIRRLTEHTEAEIRYALLAISRGLESFERIVVRSRVKQCESAIESLRIRQQGGTFDAEKIETYTLTTLRDLAGVRVLAFPKNLLPKIDTMLRPVFPSWAEYPFRRNTAEKVGFKYSGHHTEVSSRIAGEYQVVSLLMGQFWDVEHSAIYKASGRLQSAAEFPKMQNRYEEVLRSLEAFEEEFERLLRAEPLHSS